MALRPVLGEHGNRTFGIYQQHHSTELEAVRDLALTNCSP